LYYGNMWNGGSSNTTGVDPCKYPREIAGGDFTNERVPDRASSWYSRQVGSSRQVGNDSRIFWEGGPLEAPNRQHQWSGVRSEGYFRHQIASDREAHRRPGPVTRAYPPRVAATPMMQPALPSPIDYVHLYPPFSAAALVFDLDGTLVNNMPTLWKAWVATAGEFGFTFTKEDLLAGSSKPVEQWVVELCQAQGVERVDPEGAARFHEAIYRQSVQLSVPKPIQPVLAVVKEGARRGLPMAIVSDSLEEDVRAVLAANQLEGYFKAIVAREHFRQPKPHPEAYQLAARKLNVSPHLIVGYEDAPAGMASLKSAGYMKTELVTEFVNYPRP